MAGRRLKDLFSKLGSGQLHQMAREVGRRIWLEINEVNLRENILPTRERANIVLSKDANHSIAKVALRQL